MITLFVALRKLQRAQRQERSGLIGLVGAPLPDPTPRLAIRLLARATMREFTRNDWHAFAGCETSDPLIGEVDGYTLVLDGNALNVLPEGDITGGFMFELKDA